MKISIQQFGEHKAVVMNDMVIENLKRLQNNKFR